MASLTVNRTNPTAPPPPMDPFDLFRHLMRWIFSAKWRRSPRTSASPTCPRRSRIKETKDSYVFKADVPGVKESDLTINLTGTRLSVSGKREAERQQENETYFSDERSYGSFTRTFTLPEGIEAEKVNANLKDGVLTITVPKRPEAQPKKVSIKTG